jgi:hypothetical protein
MRRGVVAAVAGSLVLIGTLALRGTGGAEPDNSESAQAASYEIGLIGDMPYGDAGRQQFPRVIDEINHAHAFTTFDGDIKNGSERCDQGQYDLAAKNFAAFQAPLVYVPGDNEWTDCDRASNGSYNPNERLALIRKMFAATPEFAGAAHDRLAAAVSVLSGKRALELRAGGLRGGECARQ